MSVASESLVASNIENLPVTELLSRVGREMRELVSAADDLQSLVGQMLLAESFRKVGAVKELQVLDCMSQTLSGIADFVEALAPEVPADWVLDAGVAARVIKLSELAARLTPSHAGPAVRDRVGASDFELF